VNGEWEGGGLVGMSVEQTTLVSGICRSEVWLASRVFFPGGLWKGGLPVIATLAQSRSKVYERLFLDAVCLLVSFPNS
jgi:hypothetical protein